LFSGKKQNLSSDFPNKLTGNRPATRQQDKINYKQTLNKNTPQQQAHKTNNTSSKNKPKLKLD